MMEHRIEQLNDKKYIAFQHQGAYNQIGAAFAKLFSWIDSQKPDIADNGLIIAVYYNNPEDTPVESLRSAACIEVNEDVEAIEGASLITIPANTYAVYRHIGSYSQLPNAWNTAMRRFAEAGYRSSEGFYFEVYLSDCSTTPKEKLVTDIYLPMTK